MAIQLLVPLSGSPQPEVASQLCCSRVAQFQVPPPGLESTDKLTCKQQFKVQIAENGAADIFNFSPLYIEKKQDAI